MRCFLTTPVVEKLYSLLVRLRRRAAIACDQAEKKRDEAAAITWGEERDEIKGLLEPLELVLSADPPAPHYRPQSQCPSGFERRAGGAMRGVFWGRDLTADQYVVVCNVCSQAFSEMLVGFDPTIFAMAARTLDTARDTTSALAGMAPGID